MGRGKETSIKKLVTCGWEVLPMMSHQFFVAALRRVSPQDVPALIAKKSSVRMRQDRMNDQSRNMIQ